MGMSLCNYAWVGLNSFLSSRDILSASHPSVLEFRRDGVCSEETELGSLKQEPEHHPQANLQNRDGLPTAWGGGQSGRTTSQ